MPKNSNMPDFYLVMKSIDGPQQGRVGVAWKSKKHNGITIKLNPGVVLHYMEMEEFFLTLWPNKDKCGKKSRRPDPTESGEEIDNLEEWDTDDEDDDEIPF